MVQREQDPLNGTLRDAVLISGADAESLGVLHDGDPLVLVSSFGRFEGRVHISPIRPGNLEVHWPEGMPLLAPDLIDEESGEPDYNVTVRIAQGTRAERPTCLLRQLSHSDRPAQFVEISLNLRAFTVMRVTCSLAAFIGNTLARSNSPANTGRSALASRLPLCPRHPFSGGDLARQRA